MHTQTHEPHVPQNEIGAAAARDSIEQVSKVMEPWYRASTASSAELSSLVGRRARAYVEWPSKLTQCRTTGDLVQAQTAFWRTCAEDYAQATRHFVETWSQVSPWAAFMPAMMMNAGWADRPDAGQPPRERDTMSVPKPTVPERPGTGAEAAARANQWPATAGRRSAA